MQTVVNVSNLFLSIYSRYAVRFLLETLMPFALHRVSDALPHPESSGSFDSVSRCAWSHGHVSPSDDRERLSVVSGIYRRGAVSRLQSEPIPLYSQDIPLLSWSY